AGGPGQSRDSTIEHVGDDGDADEERGRFEVAAHRIDDAGVAAEHVAHREQAGQQRTTTPQSQRGTRRWTKKTPLFFSLHRAATESTLDLGPWSFAVLSP